MISQNEVKHTIAKALVQMGDLAADLVLVNSTSSFDPLTSTNIVSEALSSGKGIMDRTKVNYLDEVALTGEHYMLYAQFESTPELGDKIRTNNGDEFEVLFSNPVRTNNITLVYQIGLKR